MSLSLYAEKVAAMSPATAGFGMEGGRAVYPLFADDANLFKAMTEILGTVRLKGDGRLERTQPAAHPRYRWLLANRIATIQGIGNPTKVTASPIDRGSSVLYAYASYAWHMLTCEFTQPLHTSRDDSFIEMVETEWYDDDATTQTATRYSTEFKRFTSHDYAAGVELVTATRGQQKFRTGGASPNGNTFPGAPKRLVGKNVLKLTWHFVPMSLLSDDNSPIIKYLGRVNQLEWVSPWKKTYAPGSLLYVGVEIKRYLPPLPYRNIDLMGVTSYENLYVCDVTFLLDYRDVTPAATPLAPHSGNWVARGWNCKPWVGDFKFYYVTAVNPESSDDTIQAKWVPAYLSFPHVGTLFTDPVVL